MATRYLEKRIRKYVIATIAESTAYLMSLHFGNWCFTDDIERATKTMTLKMAKQVRDNYYHDYGQDIELAIIPIEISYELINETEGLES